MRPIPIQCVNLVSKAEGGCVLHPYRDGAGKWTIYTGHLIRPTEHFPAPWTAAEGARVLAADMQSAASGVEMVMGKAQLSDNQFSGLVSFAFNEGVGALAKSSLRTYILGGGIDPQHIERLFCMWNKDHDPVTGKLVEVDGLTSRRKLEAALYSTP